MKYFLFLLSVNLGMTTTALHAQTADEIIAKHIDAIGGKAVLARIKSRIVETTVTVGGHELSVTSSILYGQGFKSVTLVNGQQIVQVVTPTGGWVMDETKGQTSPVVLPPNTPRTSPLQYTLNPLVNYAASGYQLQLIGNDSVDYKLRLTGKGTSITFYVNMKSYLLDKAITANVATAQGETIISYSDYRKTDVGLLVSFAQTVYMPAIRYTAAITDTKMNFNVPVDPAIFVMPK